MNDIRLFALRVAAGMRSKSPNALVSREVLRELIDERYALRSALLALTRAVTHNDIPERRNPYSVPVIRAALMAIQRADGKSTEGHGWMDAADEPKAPAINGRNAP